MGKTVRDLLLHPYLFVCFCLKLKKQQVGMCSNSTLSYVGIIVFICSRVSLFTMFGELIKVIEF